MCVHCGKNWVLKTAVMWWTNKNYCHTFNVCIGKNGADDSFFCSLVVTARWSWHIRSLRLQPSWRRFPWSLMRWILFEEELKNCEKEHCVIIVLSCVSCWLALYLMSCALQVLSTLAWMCKGNLLRFQVLRGFQTGNVYWIYNNLILILPTLFLALASMFLQRYKFSLFLFTFRSNWKLTIFQQHLSAFLKWLKWLTFLLLWWLYSVEDNISAGFKKRNQHSEIRWLGDVPAWLRSLLSLEGEKGKKDKVLSWNWYKD